MISARKAACQALMRYEKKGTFPEKTLEKLYRDSEMEKRERALSAELTYGTMEKLLPIDYFLNTLTEKPMDKLDLPVRSILRIAAYQILYLDRIPVHAAVNEAVELAGELKPHAKSFVNGVLRNLVRQKEELYLPEGMDADALSLRFSIGKPLVELIMEQYPNQFRRILRGLDSRGVQTLYINHVISSEEEIERLTGAFPTKTPGCMFLPRGEVAALSGFAQGSFFVAGRSSVFAVQAAKPKRGELILDVCAAPGGKSFLCASLMRDEGYVLAFDVTEKKVELIRQGAERLGFSSVSALKSDATVFNPMLREVADLVLCDVPCSAIGTIHKQPEVRYKDPAEFERLPLLQHAILSNAASYVKRGGRLLYTTCTLNRRENAGVVQAFLEQHPDFSPVSVAELAREQSIEVLEENKMITILPNGELDGFFVALLQRKGKDT
ncbi:MAG: 16S rRNA (cytosine(967)-C(5))-methyltransferase RsmB [Clostridia bacterium]|nr:16S rRNA (cytosine(967)-C(5))-methyltransferase RsmB [Clostridia bacterium]